MNWIKDNWLLIFLAVVISIAAYSSWVLVQHVENSFGSFFPTENKRGDWGVLGDLFGGLLNPFFALLGLLMLLVTLYQNQKELSLSRKEFEESADALKSQAKTLEKQRFEDTFFSLLDQHNIALNNITKDRIHYDSDGYHSNLDSICSDTKSTLVGSEGRVRIVGNFEGLIESKNVLLKADDFLNQYFRILYQVLKFVATNCPTSTVYLKFSVENLESTTCSPDEKLYSNIVRSLLSSDVYYLLAINCACENKTDSFYKYRLLIERYSFLEHMPLKISETMNAGLINEILSHYNKRVFGDNREYQSAKT